MFVLDLIQENYTLKMRLDRLQKMEAEYLEEIDRLKKEVDSLKRSLDERRLEPSQEGTMNITQDPNRSTNEIVCHIDQLQQELEAREKKIAELKCENSRLQERIDILEISNDDATLNTTNDGAINELISEIENLKAVLASEQSEMKRMQVLYNEKCEDLNFSRQHIKELESTIKNMREEISERNMELEGLKVQTNSIDDTRGNSLFSEVEDRRRRAELLVKKQQSRIVELERDLAGVQSEHQKKLLQQQREIDSSLTKAHSEFVANLYAENERLSREVSRLESVENMLRDKHLQEIKDNERMSAAFRRDSSSQQQCLVKALEERILIYKCAAEKAKEESVSLRERLLEASRTHYDLTRELTGQRSLVQCLTQELQSLKENQKKVESFGEDRNSLPSMDVTVSGEFTSEEPTEEEKVECKQS